MSRVFAPDAAAMNLSWLCALGLRSWVCVLALQRGKEEGAIDSRPEEMASKAVEDAGRPKAWLAGGMGLKRAKKETKRGGARAG